VVILTFPNGCCGVSFEQLGCGHGLPGILACIKVSRCDLYHSCCGLALMLSLRTVFY
jgi:hypothetical protein